MRRFTQTVITPLACGVARAFIVYGLTHSVRLAVARSHRNRSTQNKAASLARHPQQRRRRTTTTTTTPTTPTASRRERTRTPARPQKPHTQNDDDDDGGGRDRDDTAALLSFALGALRVGSRMHLRGKNQ